MTNFAKRIDKALNVFTKTINALDQVAKDASNDVARIDRMIDELEQDRSVSEVEHDRALKLRNKIQNILEG